MSHEKLRFNILLKDQTEKEAKNNSSSYDPVYSDIKYNTHYGIFANFIGKKTKDDNNREYYNLEKILFKVQNYTGEVTLGITEIHGIKEEELNVDLRIKNFSTGRLLKVFIFMKGLNNNFDKELSSFDKKTTLNEKLYEGDTLEIIVIFEHIDNTFTKIQEEPKIRNENTIFVDPEFMLRDGEEIDLLRETRNKIERINKFKELGMRFFENENEQEKMLNKIVFSSVGGSRFCKMKISDLYIR